MTGPAGTPVSAAGAAVSAPAAPVNAAGTPVLGAGVAGAAVPPDGAARHLHDGIPSHGGGTPPQAGEVPWRPGFPASTAGLRLPARKADLPGSA